MNGSHRMCCQEVGRLVKGFYHGVVVLAQVFILARDDR